MGIIVGVVMGGIIAETVGIWSYSRVIGVL